MEKIPTATDILQKHVPNRYPKENPWKQAMIEFAKLHVEAALKEVVENVEINDYDEHGQYSPDVDRDSILNSYPLDKIK